MHREKTIKSPPGAAMLAAVLLLMFASIVFFVLGVTSETAVVVVLGCLGFTASIFMLPGFFTVNPNEARVLLLFGDYRGTVKENGFYWTNPFTSKQPISLRARNLNGEQLKVNDNAGNPIEIAAVVVWKIVDTVQATFDVDDYESYVAIQSESAVRHMATEFPYDGPEDMVTLRGSTHEVNERLHSELQERMKEAGVRIIEARLSHLAYAPEIAGAMLQRQQAAAVVAARELIVEGAVGMVEQALSNLAADDIVHLDGPQKAKMVSDLLVVLCSDHPTTPVVSVGS